MDNDKIKIIAVEDQPFQAEMLRDKLQSGGYEVIGIFASGEAALQFLENSEKIPCVAILDIEIDGRMDGIETAKELYKKYDTSIIFLSHLQDEQTRKRIGEVPAIFHSKTDSLINNISLYDAIDRLANKPISKPSSLKNNSNKIDGLVFIQSRNASSIIDVEKIVWVEADGEIAYIMLKGENNKIEKLMAKGTLKHVENTLCNSYCQFVRISKQCLVNLRMVRRINKSYIDHDGKKREVIEFKDYYPSINIGRSYKQNLKNQLEEL